MLGVCLAALGQSAEAERLLLESYRTFEASRYGALERAETASALATFYAARGRQRGGSAVSVSSGVRGFGGSG